MSGPGDETLGGNGHHHEDGRTRRGDGVSRAHSPGYRGHQRLVEWELGQRKHGCFWGPAEVGEKQDTPASLHTLP